MPAARTSRSDSRLDGRRDSTNLLRIVPCSTILLRIVRRLNPCVRASRQVGNGGRLHAGTGCGPLTSALTEADPRRAAPLRSTRPTTRGGVAVRGEPSEDVRSGLELRPRQGLVPGAAAVAHHLRRDRVRRVLRRHDGRLRSRAPHGQNTRGREPDGPDLTSRRARVGERLEEGGKSGCDTVASRAVLVAALLARRQGPGPACVRRCSATTPPTTV